MLITFVRGREARPVVLDEIVSQVPEFAGPVELTVIKGGLSHRVVRVDAGGGRFVLRVLDLAVTEAGLGVTMEQEIANTVQAAETGAGPRVLRVLPDAHALVLEYVDGRTLSAADVPSHLDGIADACRRLHSGRPFGNSFDIFEKLAEFLTLCERHGLGLPDGYAEQLPLVARIREALAARPLPAVPCHNDLLAENFIADGDRVRIVDYQLSGQNDPCFELGDIAAEALLDVTGVTRLALAYFGSDLNDRLLARTRLYLTMSNVTWTLWFTVHSGLLGGRADVSAAADFDYAAEAAAKWGRALSDLGDPGLGELLDTVRR
ncbi:choline/ethanolamine kinase family protein [Kutzneria chonburiensis]|uniref:choline/ethanolamine kinase family protein n=1 Tax=Kutzneria chonburiensis TaxID=1483604 RepID=UPI00235EA78C|nr:choline/ethanolamine kinase family protein [Kutzneria chonburiensis]